MQQSSQSEENHESGKSSGEGNELRARHDTSSKAQAGTDRPNSILISKGMTDPNEYPGDADYSSISDKRMDASLAPERDNNANTIIIKEAEIQRILSRTIEPPQQESDDPRRGGRVSSDAEEPGSADVTEISNNHEQDDITEEKILKMY